MTSPSPLSAANLRGLHSSSAQLGAFLYISEYLSFLVWQQAPEDYINCAYPNDVPTLHSTVAYVYLEVHEMSGDQLTEYCLPFLSHEDTDKQRSYSM